MRLIWYSFDVIDVAGKNLVTADALSRDPQASVSPIESDFVNAVECYVDAVINSIPASDQRLEQIRKITEKDDLCKKIIEFCTNGLPKHVDYNLISYFHKSANISYRSELLLNGSCILILSALQREMLNKIHAGHQGINKCRGRAKCSVWWPSISADFKRFVDNCHICAQNRRPNVELMIFSDTPDYPWQKVGCYLFKWKSNTYFCLSIIFQDTLK